MCYLLNMSHHISFVLQEHDLAGIHLFHIQSPKKFKSGIYLAFVLAKGYNPSLKNLSYVYT